MATGSATSRRAANTSASAHGAVEQVRVVDEHASGRSSAARLSRLSVAAPTANRSRPAPGSQREGDAEAPRLRRGDLVEQRPSAGRSSCEQPGERDVGSASTPAARSTRMPAAAPAASSSSAVLPMPGSPRSTRTPLSPDPRAGEQRPSARRSAPRPTSTSRV